MRKNGYIGNWVQYFVYDLFNWKVLKRKTSFLKKLQIFHGWWPDLEYKILLKYSFNTTKDTKLAKKYILNNKNLLHLFGNPEYPNKFFGKYDFIQDKLTPLDRYLQNNNFEDNKIVLMKYISFLLDNWKYGFCDKIFNFDRNFWVDENWNMIMLDFGELSFSKNEVEESINQKIWLIRESYMDLSEELKLYFKNIMDEFITLENLEKRWNIE